MLEKRDNVFHVNGIKLFWIVLLSNFLLAGAASADISIQTLKCATTITVLGNNSDATDFACGTAGIPLKIGLLGNQTGTTQNVRIGTAAFGPWVYAQFINNTEFPAYVNITAYSANISMRMGTTAAGKITGYYEIGYYDPNGPQNNFVPLFKSTIANSTTTTQISYNMSFNGQSGILPAGDKLEVRVWLNTTNAADRPYFYAYSSATTGNSSFIINDSPIPTYWISGYVTDQSTGAPISRAIVKTNTSKYTRTDANGYYRLPVTNGTYQIIANNNSYLVNSSITDVADLNVDNINLSLLPASSDNWRLIFDPAMDKPSNISTGFTPKIWLYAQNNIPVSGQDVSCIYWNVNDNMVVHPCMVKDNFDGSYSSTPLDITVFRNKYINVLFQVNRGAGSNPLKEQHSFFGDESNPAHGAVWKIEVLNISIGPYFNGNRINRIYMRLYSDAGLPFKNNQNTTRYTVKNSTGVTTQSGFMTYEKDGIYSFNTNTNYNDGDKYYFELVSNWTGRPTGSTGTTGTAARNTSAVTGFYLTANNTMSDNVLPEIAAIRRKPYFPVDDEVVTVTADAVDNIDISSANLTYSVNHIYNYTIPMAKQAGIEYTAQIPVYLLEDNVRYWVEIEDGINKVTSDEFMYNVQDHRGNANMSHSFLSHPVYWIGKSRQPNFLDYGGIFLNGSYSTSYKDGIAYLSTPNDYGYFKDMTRIKVQTLIMDEMGKPIQHLTNVRAWLSNNSKQDPGTRNQEKVMTEVSGDPGVYTVTWEGSPDKNYVNATCCFTWSEDSKSIWANYTSGEIYSVFVDANNDSIPEENITWLAYNFGDTMWGAAGISRTFANHSNLESVNSCTSTSCHMMVLDLNNRSIPGPTCPDCHGVFKDANDGKWPINGSTPDINDILYGNSTAHPRQNLTNTILCGDESCHNWAGTSTNRFPTTNAYIEIPGYTFATKINQTFRSTYPNPMQCAEHHDYKQAEIPLEEGHNKMVGCKFCHGGSHSNFKLKDFDIEAMATISTIEKGTPGYVGTGGAGGSGTYAGDCYKDCHRVQVAHSLTGMPGGATQNAFVPCDECHENFNNAPMHQESLFPYPDREWCGNCHQTQGTIISHNTSNLLDPPRIPATQQHAQETGIRWNSSGTRPYWVENEQSCRFCHGRSYNEAYGLGRVEKFLGTNVINGGINSISYWCSSCHVNTSSLNYNNMVEIYNNSFGVVPPEITGSTWRSDRGGYFDHGQTNTINRSDPGTYNDERCFYCHGGNLLQSVGFDLFIHDVTQARASPDCISCHNTGGNASKHVNFSAMDNSEVFHRNLNRNASSGGLSDKNKKCWACHGIIVNGYANESDQPQDTHTPDWNPRMCPDCHTTGLFNATIVTDHIPSGYATGTDLSTHSYCSTCHNNSLSEGTGIVEPQHMNSSVSHYGTKQDLIDTIGTVNASQGCVYCHFDPVNAATWGNASDPRTSIKRPHSETRNSQCSGCHIKGAIPPANFHNETLFARVSGGSPPPVPSGSSKILIATNRYVILDDWSITASLGTGFSLPGATHTSQDSWTLINTKINATALFMDDSGSPQTGKIITFNLYMPNGTEFTAARINATTNEYGLANFSFDMNARNYYGNWTVKASNSDLNDTTNFIYNWWGCGIGTCSSGHATRNPAGTLPRNSPYLSGRENPSWGNHGSIASCTTCHQSFDGKPGANAADGATHTMYTQDVHRNIRCDNANCHQTIAVHGATGQGAVIGSCYNATNCHTPANRSDITGKSTLNNSNKAIAHSEYSENNATDFNGTFHTPDSVVPCIICHGPMHNISKPDKTQQFARNNITESSQCTSCHANSSHSQNKAVDCSLCHSSDAHAPAYLTNQTNSTVANYSNNRSSAASCKDCHNNTGINSYFAGKGYDPKRNDSYGYDLTDHNNIVSCNTCHDRLHWTGYLNSTGQYQKFSSGSIECLDCHSGTNTNVSNTIAYWGYITPSRSMHNDSVPCESCHQGSKHGIRFLQPDMVSFGSKQNTASCVNCHQQGYPGAPIIPAPVNHSTNSYSGSLWNGAQQSFWVNTSQLSSCNYCHGAELHSSSALGDIEKVKGSNNIDQSLTNGYWCANCHYKNAPGYAGNLFMIKPPEILNLYGLVPVFAKDGTSFYNHSKDLLSGYDDAKCKTCHDNNLRVGSTSLNFTHNLGTGSSGGKNCNACHNISSPGTYPKVNFEVINKSVHGNLNELASSSPEYSENKPCWGCHGTVNGSFANESDQPDGHNASVYRSPRKCDDCHITGRIMFLAKNVTDHISSGYTPETDVNTSSYNPGYCSYCHNNSVNNGFEPDNMGITGGSPVNASVSHYGVNKTGNMLMSPGINSTDCVFCHRNSSNMLKWGILNDSRANISNKNASGGGTDHSLYSSSGQCSACHGGYTVSAAFTFHDSVLGNGSGASGGPDCKMCHDVAGAQKKVNFSAMNEPDSIHASLNRGAIASDNAYNESKKCWACHGDGSEPSGHPTSYKSPSKCTDCHANVSSPFGAVQVKQHYWNGTNIKTPASNNCYACHNSTGMIIPAYDPDGQGSVYGGTNGGNDSVSHYGRKRNDMAAQQNTTAYCNNCHSGVSVFPFMDSANRTISNHSLYPTNPGCRDCHDVGRLHNSTLSTTSLVLPNSTYCLSCHGNPGNINTGIKNLERHNGTGTQCTQCHLNSSSSIHPVRYIQQDNGWSGSSVNGVNCSSCHQGAGISGFGSAPKVPTIAHSTNIYSGAMWNGTQSRFWNNRSQQSSCDYCHGRYTMHNASSMGNVTKAKGMNNVRQNLSGGYWCANCHYAAAANYSGNRFAQQPPEVKNSSGLVPGTANDGTQFYNHSNDLSSGYDDAKCKTCHDNALGASVTSSNFTHSLGASSGGPNCISCHGTGGSLADGKRINQSAMNSTASLHKNLNSNAQISNLSFSESRKCWACHGDGTEPSGHQARYMTPYSCVECHVPGTGQNMNYTPNSTLLNVAQHYLNGTSIITASDCYTCHNKSEMMTGMNLDPDGAGTVGAGNGGNGSVSHYGKKRGDMAAMENTTYCNYCHNNLSSVFPFANSSNNKTIQNHSSNYAATNPGCAGCHSSGRLHSSALVKLVFNLSNGTYCLSCHGRSAGGGTNYTGAVTGPKEKHNDSLCSECHLSSTKGIHSAKYLRQNGTWAASNTSAANCTSCHQGQGMDGFTGAAPVQTPIWHSNETYSGALWNGTQARFWDNRSQQSSCDYCHGKESIHNSSGLGRSVLVQGTSLKNQSLNGSYWCANCHYKGGAASGKYSYKGDMFNPVPPEIFNLTGLVPANSSNGMPFQNHTTNIGGDWSDLRCRNCHGKDLPVDTKSAAFVHSLNTSAPETGGPDCLKCHASTATMTESEGTPLDMRVNKTAFTSFGVHRDLNSNAVSTVTLSDNRSKACWACHGDGTQPIKHHIDYMSPKGCEYCHVTGNASKVYSHYPGSVFLGTIVYDDSDPYRTCSSCHYNSIMANLNITYGSAGTGRIKNASVSHYGLNRTTGISSGVEATGILPNTTHMNGCRDCHNVNGGPYGVYGPDYGNARDIASGHNDMGSTPVECENVCHNSKKDANNVSIPVSLHDNSVGIYVGGTACYTQGCHGQPDPGGEGTR